MQMGVEVDQISKGLNRHNHPRNSILSSQCGLEEGFQTRIRALAQFAQKSPILSKIDSEDLGDGEDMLPMGNEGKVAVAIARGKPVPYRHLIS